jgi:hypothetical protein
MKRIAKLSVNEKLALAAMLGCCLLFWSSGQAQPPVEANGLGRGVSAPQEVAPAVVHGQGVALVQAGGDVRVEPFGGGGAVVRPQPVAITVAGAAARPMAPQGETTTVRAQGIGGQYRVDPELNRLQTELRRATEALRSADSLDQKTDATRVVTDVLNQLFDVDFQRRADELVQIEQRVKALREQLEQRRQRRQEIVDLQIKVIQYEADGLGLFGMPSGQNTDLGNWEVYRGAPVATTDRLRNLERNIEQPVQVPQEVRPGERRGRAGAGPEPGPDDVRPRRGIRGEDAVQVPPR